MKSSVVFFTDKNGNSHYEARVYPDKHQPDISGVDREFYELDIKGLFCYGLKVIVKLIKHFKYDGSKWHEFLLCMSDYTLIDMRNSIGGRCSKHWEMDKYSPNEILAPVVMTGKNGKAFLPCDSCGQAKWLFGEFEDECFCLNFKNCGYVKDHYRYNCPNKNQYSIGKYKEYYDLYMETDINLLRVIYDTISLTNGTIGEVFDGNSMPLIADMINVCKETGIEPPDLVGIPKEGYGKGNVSFDCIGLIEG